MISDATGSPRRSVRLWIALAAIVTALVALVNVTITGPRVTVLWRADITSADRETLEHRYVLLNGEPDKNSPATWQYRLDDWSRENVGELVRDPAAVDTGYIDRPTSTVERPDIRISMRPSLAALSRLPFPFRTNNTFSDPRQLFQIQSLWLLLAGGVILATARATSERRRRRVTVAVLVLFGVMATAFPISPHLVRMGDSGQTTQSRQLFERTAGVNAIRFEAHLSYAILGQLDRLFGRTNESPERAQIMLARAATGGFVLCALMIGFLERWSPVALRYLALGLLAPSALLYFGWREFGYLSLNIAAFPLIAGGLRDGGKRLEAGSLLAGLGAALHGWGLVSLMGAWVAALVSPAPFLDRVGRVLRIAAWGTAAYTGWIAWYVIVLKLPITLGHVSAIPWRPWFVDEFFAGRINPAIFSAAGGRILLMTAWVVGAPLLVIAASLWRQCRNEVLTAFGYALPSLIFAVLLWHTQGLNEDMDVVFGIFPGFYALAWICARDPASAKVAAALLVSAHLALWRIVLDTQFASIHIPD